MFGAGTILARSTILAPNMGVANVRSQAVKVVRVRRCNKKSFKNFWQFGL